MVTILKRFWRDETGLETAEKAALIVLALIVAVGAFTTFAPKVKDAFTTSGTTIDNARNFTY